MPRSAWMRESDHRITRALVRSGVLVAQEYDDEEQLWLDLDPEGEDALTQLQGASIRFAVAVGPIAGRKTLRLHTPGAALDGPVREPPKPFTAARDGFSLNAAVAWLRPAIAGSWSACAAMWRAPPLPWSVSAATATDWWSTS